MANITNCLLRTSCASTFMDTVISADTTMTVFPIMGFFISNIGTAAITFFLMCFCCLFPHYLAAVICLIFFCIFLAAVFADSTLCTVCFSSAVHAYITTYFTSTVFPIMISFFYRYFATAIIFLFMLCRCLCPFFCSSMIICIYFSILNMANITNCLLRTGCISTCMDAVISADTTMTVFPIMSFYISTIGTAAVIFFLMCFCCLFPYFIAVMICRV